jgi:hypothetical protein
MSSAQDKRIAELESQNALLKSELERMRQHISRLELRLDVGQPRGMITEVNDDVFAMPSDHQMRRLVDNVVAKYPSLGGANFDQVSGAFLALGYVRRTNTLDTSRINGAWTGLVEDWLRQHGRGMTIYVQPFCAAVVAHGDIPFAAVDRFKSLTGLGFGLCYQGVGTNSYPARDAWKKLLDGTSAVREPIDVPALRQAPNAVGPVRRSGIGITT